MATASPQPAPPAPARPRNGRVGAPFRRQPSAAAMALALVLAGLVLLGGCAQHYNRGQFLEQQGRWEEAAIEYHLAVIDDPQEPEYQEAFQRAQKVVARENMERYRDYLANKAFHKAYDRLVDASRQDPTYAPVEEEMAKWTRVLVGGQVAFEFESLRANLALADEIQLVVRINSPNPGQTLDAEVDVDTGTFFVEDLLYDRPSEMLTFYSLNSVGVRLVRARSATQQFTTSEFRRFINYRTPVLDQVTGRLALGADGTLHAVTQQRAGLQRAPWLAPPRVPTANPHYSLNLDGKRIEVTTDAGTGDFTPRLLYINREDRRMFVDFGRYEVLQTGLRDGWQLRRLPLGNEDYFDRIARNVALQPYFYYRDGVFTYVPQSGGL